jgi:hypothetical protein
LKKTSKKMSELFEAHCVDSWVLANSKVGGHLKPENIQLLCVTPLRLHRRQLHRLQPDKSGERKPYGGTRSLGFRRGGLVSHPKYKLCYVGGMMGDRISLHSILTGKRLTQTVKPVDCKFKGYGGWRTRLLPALKSGVSASEKR